jgi:hypothetical protein
LKSAAYIAHGALVTKTIREAKRLARLMVTR